MKQINMEELWASKVPEYRYFKRMVELAKSEQNLDLESILKVFEWVKENPKALEWMKDW